MEIRIASLKDLTALTEIENICFPEAEACDRKTMLGRVVAYPRHFWVMEEREKMISFIDGMVTNERTIRDEMYADPTLHNEQGMYQAVFGVNTLPEYRRKGYAAQLMTHLIADARAQGRRGCILTCKEALIPYYQKFGYRNLGVSESVHGGAVWYDMILEF
ncbi:MAG: GNAT family N-acetyltransferase [Oscillibacter sp.]|nr:GNAT family N-acetyltransferase [Oscillibacter sp.]